MADVGSVRVYLRNVRHKGIYDDVSLAFINQRVHSYNRIAELPLKGRPGKVEGIPRGPNGLYQVHITPTKYRYKSRFLSVRKKLTEFEEVLLVDPEHVQANFPSFSQLGSKPKTKKLSGILSASGFKAAKYKKMDDLTKAGLLNLFAKMNKTKLPGGTVFDHVVKILKPKPARFLARVSRDLIELVRKDRAGFHAVPGSLHHFPAGWTRVEHDGSFKTHDKAGNLQLTFAENSQGNYLVDADIDDHQGVKHAFDVLQHKLTGKDTHPYNIHQILIFFQRVDPGYELF